MKRNEKPTVGQKVRLTDEAIAEKGRYARSRSEHLELVGVRTVLEVWEAVPLNDGSGTREYLIYPVVLDGFLGRLLVHSLDVEVAN